MRLSSLIVLLLTLIPGALLADQAALVIRQGTAYDKPVSGAIVLFKVRAGMDVDVLARKGGWKQVREAGGQRIGWVRSYLVRESSQYRSSVVATKQDSNGFLAGLASLSRRVTGFFTTPSASTSGAVATIGIRGRSASSSSGEDGPPRYWLSPKRIVESKGDEAQLNLLQSYARSKKAGRKFASAGGLKARSLALLGGK